MAKLTPEYMSLQGEIMLYDRDVNGNPTTGYWVGDANAATLGMEESTTKYKENYTGKRATALEVANEIVNSVGFTLLQQSARNLVELWRGEEVTQSVTPVVGKTISSATLQVGDRYMLGAENVSSVVIKDSAGSPATLVSGTDYELDATTGRLKLLNAGSYTGPLTADFTPGASKSAKLLTGVKKDFWLSLVGVNTVVTGQPKGVLDLYKVTLALPASLSLIDDERGEYPITGTPLIDSLKSSSGPLGQLGRISGFGLFD